MPASLGVAASIVFTLICHFPSWTRKSDSFWQVHLVTSKLDQAHGKAREIEAVVIACIAFDNRFCHALTLNRFVLFLSLLSCIKSGCLMLTVVEIDLVMFLYE